jgi:Skp family chaperone for outer membrane proteins
MLQNKHKILIIIALLALASPSLFSQGVGFVNSEAVRQKFPEAEQAEQLIQTIVDEWKLEIKAMTEQISKLEYDIKKNRLIWSDEERQKNETALADLQKEKTDFTTEKFSPGGEFDKLVKKIMAPVLEKLNVAVQNGDIK